MFAGQTNTLPYIRNYKEANDFFLKTNKPPRSKKWEEHQRPLRDSRSLHYRIETGTTNPGEYYDLCLYNTVMARFHKPDENNVERRQYLGHHSQTSRSFMWDVLGVRVFDNVKTTDGREVIAPVYNAEMPSSKFSADYYFDVSGSYSGFLITDRSAHTRHYKKVSSSSDKAERALTKKALEPLLTMAVMRMPEYEAECEMTYFMGQPFGGSDIRSDHKRAAQRLCEALLKKEQGSPGDYDLFFAAGQCVFDKLASDVAYKQGVVQRWGTKATYDALPEEHRITEKQFAQSMWRFVHDAAGLDKRSGKVEYPQFASPDEMTFSNVILYP